MSSALKGKTNVLGGGHDHYTRLIWGVLCKGDVGNATPPAQTIYLQPVIFPFDFTITRIGWINGGAVGAVKAGLYEDNGDTPDGGALLTSSGVTLCAGNNQKQEAIVTDYNATAALYWLAVLLMSGYTYTNAFKFITAADGWFDGGSLTGYEKAIASDDLPNPCPTGLSASNFVLYALGRM